MGWDGLAWCGVVRCGMGRDGMQLLFCVADARAQCCHCSVSVDCPSASPLVGEGIGVRHPVPDGNLN